MSHYKERKEKNCLNCNAEVQGRYCHICGQENIEPKETFWALATHFVYDIMHFDGKFFSTLKYLLLKPGFLSHEYLRGRRASYLHPIKMYVFTSAIFFIIFFAFIVDTHELGESVRETGKGAVDKQVARLRDSLQRAIEKETDSADRQQMTALLHNIAGFSLDKDDSLPAAGNTDVKSAAKVKVADDDALNIGFTTEKDLPPTVAEYDSLQKLLPEKQRDGWFKRTMKHRAIIIKEKYGNDQSRFLEDFMEKFLHSIPQAMFITLPLVALIMQLLYIRKRKEVFYVNHVIFLTHVYIALFICFLVSFGISELHDASGWKIFSWLNILVTLYMLIYTPWAMVNFYEQGIVKSGFKYFILLFFTLFLYIFVFSIFAVKSLL